MISWNVYDIECLLAVSVPLRNGPWSQIIYKTGTHLSRQQCKLDKFLGFVLLRSLFYFQSDLKQFVVAFRYNSAQSEEQVINTEFHLQLAGKRKNFKIFQKTLSRFEYIFCLTTFNTFHDQSTKSSPNFIGVSSLLYLNEDQL